MICYHRDSVVRDAQGSHCTACGLSFPNFAPARDGRSARGEPPQAVGLRKPYDDLAGFVRELAHARLAAVVVIEGIKGSGASFQVQGDTWNPHALVHALRELANELELVASKQTALRD